MRDRVTGFHSGDQFVFRVGFFVSLGLHVLFAIIVVTVLETNAANATLKGEIFTVTLEGGEKIGGVGQVPTEDTSKVKKALPKISSDDNSPNKVEPPKEPEKPIEQPTVVDEAALKAEEQKKEDQKKKIAEEKVKAEKLKAEEEKKEKEEEQKKADEKKKLEDKKLAEKEKKERDRKLEQAIKTAGAKYHGESADAGGDGFGAASLGGKGMGGGTLQSLEFVAYSNQLKAHIKSNWHWLAGADRLQAGVEIRILPSGIVQDAAIVSSSGNSSFDDSAVRAVFKASPVPIPPENLYEKFRQVVITFDSHE